MLKMYFVLKLIFIILILNLKLNDLNALPVIDTTITNTAIDNDYERSSNSSNNTNNNNNNNRNSSGSGGNIHTKNQNISKNNAATLQQSNSSGSVAAGVNFDKDNNNTTSDNSNHIIDNINIHNDVYANDNDNHIINIQKNTNKKFLNESINVRDKNYYYYYKILKNPNVNNNNNNQTPTTMAPLPPDLTATTTTNKVAAVGATKNSSLPNFINELPFYFANATTTTTTISSNIINSNELELDDDFNDIVSNATHNKSDVEAFLMKRESYENTTCLLDDIKLYFMWWSFQNGTLREENFNISGKATFLDISYQNLSKDEQLYAKTKSFTRHKRKHQIVAFSAAYNNLTSAPFKTLALMNNTLKYLTLKGNQFAAYTEEMQKEALFRFINDTSKNSDGQTEENYDDYHNYYNYLLDNNNNNNNSNDNLDTVANSNGEYQNTNDQKNYRIGTIFGKKEEGIAWATFPLMSELVELDISNCHIEYIKMDAFKNLTNLRKLFISHNQMMTIPHDTFHYVPLLHYLDLSFTNFLYIDYQLPFPTVEAVFNLLYGVKIQQTTFKLLPELVYLDLSHTKLTRNSAVAFTHLGENLQYLSLCYTAFPMLGNALFKNTGMIGLDISGNPYAAYNVIEDAFEGIADTLKFLYFEQSNIKDLAWLKYLSNLRVLGLASNNINSVSTETFSPLRSLQVLDLRSNHVGNWYNRAFAENQNLQVLNLRDNNINIINLEMLYDFQMLDYLSLGDNNFVCDCLLHDLIEVAAANKKDAECSRNVLQNAQDFIIENRSAVGGYLTSNISEHLKKKVIANQTNDNNVDVVDFLTAFVMNRYIPELRLSYKNLKNYAQQQHIMLRFPSKYLSALSTDISPQCPESEPTPLFDKLNGTTLKFQLLDYEDEHYWCFNETQRMHFVQLNCQSRNYEGDIAEQLHTLTKYVLACVGTIIGIILLGIVIYLKRWHIHYYYSSLKSAALLSVATKDSVDKFNAMAEQDPNLIYDIFISYCDTDRQWVLEELLPNVEETGDISICMHERDFQIGVTILDNIINAMDRSRALMLIISQNFLLSRWCQFEMHLAQHRIFEASKEHLIIVFLEDIPRNKRPKTLQYLMEVKTYIKWPIGKGKKITTPEERKLFWKRLKRAIENISTNHHMAESSA